MEIKLVKNIEPDVLVVGSGFAGLTAAIEARLGGKKVMVIEKMKSAGGNSIISDGGLAAPGTELQKKLGIEDSEELMYEDMLRAGLGINDSRLVRIVVKNAKDAFEWTRNFLEVPFLERVDLFGGHSVARCYTPEGVTGRTIMKKMLQKIKELDIPIHYSTFLQDIHTDGSGRVVACSVLRDYDYKSGTGKEEIIKVKKRLILAAGGYGADVAFRSKQDPRLDESIQTTNKPFATAETLQAALDIGAASVQLSQIQLGAWASPDEKGFGYGPLFADYVLFQYGMIVDPQTGKRFVNELGDRKQIADALLDIGHPCIGIADAGAVQQAGWDISKAIEKGVVRLYQSIEDLADFYGIDIAEMKESLERYNRFVLQDRDEDYSKPIVERAKPIVTKSLYAMRLWPKVHFTMGGLAINERAQVLNAEGKVIEGLYAAGEIVGGVHGASRLGSCAVTECIVFGRIAGRGSLNNFKSLNG